MSEEEIIKDIDNVFYNLEDMMSEMSAEAERVQWQRFKDLYQQEKEKNKELLDITNSYKSFSTSETGQNFKIVIADERYFCNHYFTKHYISKDKIKAKIEELNKELSGMTIYFGKRASERTKETIQQLIKEANIKTLQELLKEN